MHTCLYVCCSNNDAARRYFLLIIHCTCPSRLLLAPSSGYYFLLFPEGTAADKRCTVLGSADGRSKETEMVITEGRVLVCGVEVGLVLVGEQTGE